MKRLFTVILCILLISSFDFKQVAFAETNALINEEISPKLEIKHDNFKVGATFSYDSPSDYNAGYQVLLAMYDENNKLIGIKCSDEKTIKAGQNKCELSLNLEDNMKKAKAFVWTDKMEPMINMTEKNINKVTTLKVLAIGNSFSVDGMQWLYNIAQNCGVEKIVLGNLYIGGCSLSTHWNNANNNNASYTYYKNTNGSWTTQSSKTMLYGITDEDWDIISMQQASPDSGVASTYDPYLSNLINYVNSNKTNPNSKFAWHMTWAYQSDSTHASFPVYNSDQMTMYNAIVNAAKSKVLTKTAFEYFIPSGTAIQNVRTSYIGDTLTRDGYHLSLNLGRYIAGMTWFHSLTGLSIDNITYVPSTSEIPEDYLKIVKESVNAAIDNPLQVTPSSYDTEEEINLDNYTLLDWQPKGESYWNSTSSGILVSTANSTASNLKYYISSKMFTKADLPNGTLIVIDPGYQYRPEGWVNLSTVNSGANRPSNTTANVVEITDSWWGSFNYRAFNISYVGSTTDIRSIVPETASHFRIYIPK